MKKYAFICALNFLYLFFLFFPSDNPYHGALPHDIENTNTALLFTLTNEGGRIENINTMQSIFANGKLGFICEPYHNKSASFIYEKITTVTSELNEDSTLLVYLNGHGGGSNKNFAMDASDQKLKFSKLLEAIKKGKPVKRLVLFVDTCHAEGAINEGFQGGGRLLRSIKPKLVELNDNLLDLPLMFKENNQIYFGENTNAYEELLIIASSSAAELTTRGVFARNMKRAFDQIQSNKDATVYDFLKLFAELDAKSGQQPYYKAIPEGMLNEPLLKEIPARSIPIKDKENNTFKKNYILLPE